MKNKFIDSVERGILVGDGAMGTMVQILTSGEDSNPPERIMLDNPQLIENIHQLYVDAGAKLLETNTFGANRLKLETLGLVDKIEDINTTAVKLARKAIDNGIVAGSIGPTGKLMEPFGNLNFSKAYDVYFEQVSYLVKAGIDVIIIETMSDLGEMRAALIAARDVIKNDDREIPIIAQMTFDQGGYTLTGSTAEVVAIVLEGLGADVIGVNCVAGLSEALPILEQMAGVTDLPLSLFPNAGMPVNREGKTIYPETPDEFTAKLNKLFKYNVRLIGGCCGTKPVYIKEIKSKLAEYLNDEGKLLLSINDNFKDKNNQCSCFLTGNREYIEINSNGPVQMIGEKLNPTGRLDLKKALREEDWSYLKKIARDQVRAGANLLDVNIGISDIDRNKVMEKLISELQMEVHGPLVLDSDDPEVLEAGLKEYIGKPLINSVTGEQKVMDKIFPLVKKYGAAVIGLTLDENGIPATVADRVDIAHRIVKEAEKYKIDSRNIFIDTLTLTAGSNQNEVMVTLEALKKVKEELGVMTTLGISNISHGLPERNIINEVFLTMALGYGLDLPIANPFDDRIHNQIRAANLLTNRDHGGEEFLSCFGKDSQVEKELEINKNDCDTIMKEVGKAVVKGDRDQVLPLTKKAIVDHQPEQIINKVLIPAINKVGDLYDNGSYFLPQLLKSAETMQKSFDFLKDKLSIGREIDKKATLLLATVKGDIHDIGKNIVKSIFMNYGYEIIDLGANVASELVVEKAIDLDVDFVGLSSLMTTTLKEMKKIVFELKEKDYQGSVIIGGAVTSQEFADEIGADIYAKNALDGVRKANDFLKKI